MASQSLSAFQHLSNPSLLCQFVLENIFTPEECDKIIQLSADYPLCEDPYIKDPAYLQQSLCPLRKIISQEKDYSWILERIHAVGKQVNERYYHFDIVNTELSHFLEYRDGRYIDWHTDMTDALTTNRKMTMVLLLSEPDTYVGGKLSFNPKGVDFIQKKGAMLFFPSFLLHHVAPVTAGVRYTLATFSVGPSFR